MMIISLTPKRGAREVSAGLFSPGGCTPHRLPRALLAQAAQLIDKAAMASITRRLNRR